MGRKQDRFNVRHSLCWDCANAIGTCSWSDRLEPVDGWHAERSEKGDTWNVIDCPEFDRDARNGGTKRLEVREL